MKCIAIIVTVCLIAIIAAAKESTYGYPYSSPPYVVPNYGLPYGSIPYPYES